MSLIERMARAIYETQDNPVPWDSDTLGDWRRDYEREKARVALAVVRDHDRGAVHERDVFARALALAQPNERAREALIAAAEKALASPPAGGQ